MLLSSGTFKELHKKPKQNQLNELFSWLNRIGTEQLIEGAATNLSFFSQSLSKEI